MPLVKCSECNKLVSNKTTFCLHCGYSPRGICGNCKHFLLEFGDTLGKCSILENEYVRKDKSICPAVIKRFTF